MTRKPSVELRHGRNLAPRYHGTNDLNCLKPPTPKVAGCKEWNQKYMIGDDRIERIAPPPVSIWENVSQAKAWLIQQRHDLGWLHKDVAKAFFDCAVKSDLFIGQGGGPKFDRATEKRVARFEREGTEIPEWLVWMPIAIQYALIPWSEKWTWARTNIPMNSDVRHDRETAEIEMRQYDLSDEEIVLIEGFRRLSAGDRKAVIAAFLGDGRTKSQA